MISVATVHLKEGGPLTVTGTIGASTNEDNMVHIHSHDLTTGNCRDTYIPRENVIAVSVEYRD